MKIQIGGMFVVLLKKTEEKYKREGIEKAEEIYQNKLNNQIKKYDKKIDEFDSIFKEKDALINDIEAAIAEYKKKNTSKNDFYVNEIISVLSECKDNLNNDIKITTNKRSSNILVNKNELLDEVESIIKESFNY